MRTIFLALILTFVFNGFVSAKTQTTVETKVLINKQKIVTKDKVAIKFVSLIEDSRCPTDTSCIWAGNAKIKVQISKGKSAQTFELNSNLEPQTVEFAGYDIKLINLDPKPASNIRINRNGYTATFSITKLQK